MTSTTDTPAPCSTCAPLVEAERVRADDAVAEAQRLRSQLGGRPASKARDAKTKLVRAACANLGISRRELAERLSTEEDPIGNALLSPSREIPAKSKDRVMKLLRDLAGAKP